MTQLTSSTSSASVVIGAPSSITREIDRLTGIFTNRLEEDPANFRRRRIPASRAPANDDRARLEARRAELRASLIPTPGPVANRSITLLIASKTNFGADERELTVKVGFYAEALRDMPAWAIEDARLRLARPGWRCLWDGKGCPSEADVGVECRHILLPIEAELARLDAVLDAEPYETGATDDDRAGAVAHWEAVKAEMAREAGITQRSDEEISAERTEQQRSNERFEERDRRRAEAEGRELLTWGRIPISDELGQQLRRMAAARAPRELVS